VGLYDLPSITIATGWNELTSRLVDPSEPEVVVRLEGEFDASNSENLLEQLKVLVADEAVDLTLDLSRVGFFSASTIGVIVQLTETFRHDNRRLQLLSPSHEVQRVFSACGLSALLPQGGSAANDSGSQSSKPTVKDADGDASALASWVTVPNARIVTEEARTVNEAPTVTEGRKPGDLSIKPLRQNFATKPLSVKGSGSVAGSFATNSVGSGWS
jgi:anti-anti-sigma factor